MKELTLDELKKIEFDILKFFDAFCKENDITYYLSHGTLLGAIRYKKLCEEQGISAKTSPVPRDLSSSCGTCVRCEGGYVTPTGITAEEVDTVVAAEEGGYRVIFQHED